MKKHLKAAAGFTLVELIVVIAILGILTAIAVPTYSGYVKKANLAADQTLLNSVNTAFAAACIENGVDIINDVSSATLVIDDETKTVDVDASTLVNDDVKADFGTYFGADSSAKFKVATTSDILFNETTHMFEIDLEKVSVAYGDYEFSISQKLAAALGADHSFKEIGADKLLGKVDKVSDIAGALIGATNDDGTLNMTNTFNKLVYAQDENGSYVYLDNLAASLGMDPNSMEFLQLVWTEDENENPVLKSSVIANSLVLTAAQKTQGMDTSFLGTAGSAATLRTQLDNSATATDAMAKLALTYGMYTSYVKYANTNPDVPDMEDKSEALLEQGEFSGMTAILADIESEEFRTYLAGEQGQKDLNAYMASMQIVNDSANQSSEATQDILTNGFTDPNLVAALNGLMNGSVE